MALAIAFNPCTICDKKEMCSMCELDMRRKGNVETIQEWISVKDRLPEYGSKVLAYAKNSIESRTFIAIFRNQRNKGMWWDREWSIEVLSVTHWMPLPQPPKGEQ